MKRILMLVALAAMMVALVASSAGQAFADPENGNSDAAHFCQGLTYPFPGDEDQNLPTFKNRGDCVSYFAHQNHSTPLPPS